jgi:hypothetical protein
MKRHNSMYRGHRRFWLTRTIVARQPLVAQIARHQQLLQAFGLTVGTAGVSQRVSALTGRSFQQAQQVALPMARSVFRPPLIRQAKGNYGISPAQDEPEEVPGQQVANVQSGNQDLEVGGQVPLSVAEQPPEQPGTESTGSKASESGSEVPVEQKRADAQTQPKEIAKAKRSRWHIEEHPPEAGYALASPPAPSASVTRRDDQKEKTLEKSDVNLAAMSSEVSEADELFAPCGTDRSPQAWIARLMGAKSATRDDGDASQTRSAPAPLSQRTRRFLQPLVGVDPASVRVQRDAIAERLTDAYQADAITVGDDIEVAVGYPDDTPETLGLLAHELTHVAREREPHFVPPIARSMRPSLSRASRSSLADEETLALQVERQVKRVAQEQVDQVAPVSTNPSGGLSPVRTVSAVPVSRATHDAWGGLPAPWEPLPDWLVSLPVTSKGSAQAPVVPSQPLHIAHGTGASVGARFIAPQGSGDVQAGDTSGDTGVQRAGRERSVDMEEGQAARPTADATKAPEPNLDELARQVYSLLKRRLGVESRREN